MELDQLIAGIEKLLSYMFGESAPTRLLPTISWIVSICLILFSVVWFLELLKKLWTEFIRPVFYDPEERRREFRRRLFADHIESEIRNMNSLEAWNDNRFTELEARVEAEGRQRWLRLLPARVFNSSSVRLEKSLSRAIERSNERLVLLEGDPGSGKSVALRHVTQLMAAKARSSRNLKARIPIYVNLKYLRRIEHEDVDRNLVEKFIFKTLNRVNDRDIDEYLHDEFKRGLEEGTWFFLFDSFDEIPEVLSSTGTDDIIRTYAEAIRDFLHGMNKCKGIVASREYKGPRFLGWPKFRILPLESSRRIELVKKTNFPVNVQKNIIDGLAISTDDFKSMASNPLFLNLICDFMNKPIAPEFPKHIHIAFKEYIRKRLTRDEERVQQRFSRTSQIIQDAAEKLAYCMTADQGVGLSPTLDKLVSSTRNMGLDLGEDFDILVEALAYLKLARIDISFEDGSKTFTFAHRRFQEYFATAIVLNSPNSVSDYELLTNGRWRETAVVILQTQKSQRTESILNLAEESIRQLCMEFIDSNFEPLNQEQKNTFNLPKYKWGVLAKYIFEPFEKSRKRIKEYLTAFDAFQSQKTQNFNKHIKIDIKAFIWPQNLYHLLSILQEGLVDEEKSNENGLVSLVDKVLFFVSQKGDLIDERICLELIGAASDEAKTLLITNGIRHERKYTSRIAFQKISTMSKLSDEISEFVVETLFNMVKGMKLFRNRQEIYAQLSRIDNSMYFLHVATLFAWAPIIDISFMISGILLISLEPSYKFIIAFALFFLWRFAWFSEFSETNTFVAIGAWLAQWAGRILVNYLVLHLIYLQSASNYFEVLPSLITLSRQSISVWYFFFATGWWSGLSFHVYASGKIKAKPYNWPFYGLRFVVSVWFLVVITSYIFNFLNFYDVAAVVKEILVEYNIYSFLSILDKMKWGLVAMLLAIISIDSLYIIPRLNLIYQEAPPEKRDIKHLVTWIESSQVWVTHLWLYITMLLLTIGSVGLVVLTFRILFNTLGVLDAIVELFSWLGQQLDNYIVYIFGAFVLVPVLIVLFDLIRSTIKFQRWRRQATKMTFLELIGFLSTYNQNFIRNWILEFCKDHSLINGASEDLIHLRNMITYVSAQLNAQGIARQGLRSGVAPESLVETQRAILDDVRADLKVRDIALFSIVKGIIWTEQLDQLCELLDQLKSS